MNSKGTYILVLTLQKPARISFGRFPETEFRSGTYLYIGSAKNGLRARLLRYLRKEKKLHWHIDYLLEEAAVEAVWIKQNFYGECLTAQEIATSMIGNSFRINQFGSSDCRCKGHLFFSSKETGDLEPLRTALGFEKISIQGNHV